MTCYKQYCYIMCAYVHMCYKKCTKYEHKQRKINVFKAKYEFPCDKLFAPKTKQERQVSNKNQILCR